MKRFISWLINSSGMAWATFLIVVAQGFHYFHLFIGIKLFEGSSNFYYAIFLTGVFSMPLMIFTTKLGSIRKRKDKLREFNDKISMYKSAVNWYTGIDIIINIYTWYTKLRVFEEFELKSLPLYIVITTIAILLPVTLKKFAGEVKVK